MSSNLTILDILILDEIEIIETITGKDVSEIFTAGRMINAKEAKAIIWVLKKRLDPAAKIEDAGKFNFKEAGQYMTDYLDSLKAKV